MKRISLISIFLSFFFISEAQEIDKRLSINFTIHNNQFKAEDENLRSQIGFGLGGKFRINKDQKNTNLILGFGLEQWPIQRYYAFENIYYKTSWTAFSIQFGIQTRAFKSLKLNPFLSLDSPFRFTEKWPNEPKSSRNRFYISQMSMGLGTDLTYEFNLKNNSAIIMGTRIKFNTLIAFRKSDFWIYSNDDEYPFYFGIILGYRI